ncbi:fructose-bisphosphate aldolase [Clavulina sp. PMI_390]|nr:fructose-bisphosphate aldolase [Clavulina sp. PMI_390]
MSTSFEPKNDELARNARALVANGKGLLAADESTGSIKKPVRFDSVSIESTEETRRHYREVLLTAEPPIEQSISGVILFTEQLEQKDAHGVTFPEVLRQRGILSGSKTDLGTQQLALGQEGETFTKGLDGLKERSEKSYALGARFAKWRVTYVVGDALPSQQQLSVNAENLAQYAAISQQAGLVPIVEPEVLTSGSHDLQRALDAQIAVLGSVFDALRRHAVRLDATILKCSMVLPGDDFSAKESVTNEDIANATLTALCATVPPAIPGIVFLSGGQSPLDSVQRLDVINKTINKHHAYHHAADASPRSAGGDHYNPFPWKVSFSFGRALQADALELWAQAWKLREAGKGEKDAKKKEDKAAGEAFAQWAEKSRDAAKGEFQP